VSGWVFPLLAAAACKPWTEGELISASAKNLLALAVGLPDAPVLTPRAARSERGAELLAAIVEPVDPVVIAGDNQKRADSRWQRSRKPTLRACKFSK
jgi:hypothetical protein